MNMISTGALKPETSTEIGQKNSLVAELVAKWEGKNAKALKAGGVSLMALSLAACGSDDSTTTTATTTTTTDTTTTTTTSTEGVIIALGTGADAIGPNALTATAKTTAGDDILRAGSNGELTSSDYIDGGDGSDSLTAAVTEGAAATTIKPMLTSVETVKVTMTAISGDTVTTFNLSDSTGLNSLEVVNADDADVTISGVTGSHGITLSGVAGTAMDSVLVVTRNDLTTATSANGGGEDTGTINLNQLDAASLTYAGVETVTLNMSGKAVDVDTVDMDGLEKLVITGGVADASITTEVAAVGTSAASANSAIDFEGLDTGETGVIDASASTGDLSLIVDDSVDLTVTGGAGKLTIANTSAGGSAATGTAEVTVTAGAGGIAATLEGGGNTATTAMNVITVTGSDAADTVDVTGAVAPTDRTTTVENESQTFNVIVNTGAGNDVLSANIGNVSINAGAGDDKLTMSGISSTELTAYDTIDMGDGSDTVSTADATLNTSDNAQLARISNAEILETTAVGDKTADLTAISAFTTLRIDAHTAQDVGTSAASSGTDGADGLDMTIDSTNNTVIIDDITLVGEIGGKAHTVSAGDSGGNGGIGLDVNVSTDRGNDTLNITMIDNADINGGAGGADNGDSGFGGDGGIGVTAESVDIVNITLSATDTVADVVTFGGGAAGAASGTSGGTASDVGIQVATNATINITESISGTATATKISSIDLNTITGNNVTVDASTLTGAVTINAVSGNTSITTGSGADTISAGTGADIIVAGGGDDTIDAQAGKDTITGGDGNDSFVINDGDAAEATFTVIKDFTLVSASWTGSTTVDTVAEFQSTNAGSTGLNADILDLDHSTAITLEADATSTASANSTANVTYAVSNGIVTLGGSAASTIDTLGEWVDEVEDIVTAAHQIAAFEFSGSTYVYMEDGTDAVIKLEGVTGVAGIDLLGGAGVEGGANYIMVI